jgi:predicted nucleic acid-binding protein
MGKVVLDTSSWIDLERNTFNDGLLKAGDRVIMAAAALAELKYALAVTSRTPKQREQTKTFIQDALLVSDFEPIDEKTAEIFAQLKVHCKNTGTPRGLNDLWIAATAIRHNAVLVSSDRKALFAGLPKLKFRP